MPPIKELPGFYFDLEKNRYFPIKAPIPGLKRPSPSSAESLDQSKKHQISKARRRHRIKPLELLQFREVLGTVVTSNKCRYSFIQEYEKSQASHPLVWKYQRTDCVADTALEQMYGIVETPIGLKETYLLAAGSMNGSLRLYDIGNVGNYSEPGGKSTPELVWPDRTKHELSNNTALGSIWCLTEPCARFASNISCIRKIGKHCPDVAYDASSSRLALVTILGGVSGGSVHIMNLSEPLDFRSSPPHLHRRIAKVATLDCTVWTADCCCNGTHAVVGTNFGAALINLETRTSSWVYRGKSDVLSQQFDHSGNIVLCGLRNGAIVSVDVREKQLQLSDTSPSPFRPRFSRRVNPPMGNNRSKQKFETGRSPTFSNKLFMPSAVCSLVALQSDDQYFLGSAMDGSISLFDRRLLRRGAIQSYEGHVNSHNHLQLGVNPSETLILSGGGDRCVRIWSLKTAELLFEENVSDSILKTVYWSQGSQGVFKSVRYREGNPFGRNHSWGAWLGSVEGLVYMHGT